ncbi:MAG: hypothetical protein IJL35_02790 [Bacteroidaceae bacterium]|nr:hypothetical protein [Bacteroidaceae bacterium]
MIDQELYDIFHSYHPEMSSEEDFMARLNGQMDGIDKKRLPSVWEKTKQRHFLPWVAGIAAVIAVGLFLFMPSKTNCPEEADIYPARQDYQTMLSMTQSFPTFEETVREIEQSGQQLQMAIAEMKE